MAKRLNYVFCPNNYPTENQAPEVEDIVDLKLRNSNTSHEDGLALIDATTGLFKGWVRRFDIEDAVWVSVRDQACKVVDMEEFYWPKGGGMCRRGVLEVITI